MRPDRRCPYCILTECPHCAHDKDHMPGFVIGVVFCGLIVLLAMLLRLWSPGIF